MIINYYNTGFEPLGLGRPPRAKSTGLAELDAAIANKDQLSSLGFTPLVTDWR